MATEVGRDVDHVMSLPSNDGGTKRKAPDEVPSDSVKLKVQGQDGRFLHFSVKRHTPLIRVMKTYCERRELDYRTMRFFYKGNRIHGKQTPERLNMEENEEISALMQQTGGGIGQQGLLY